MKKLLLSLLGVLMVLPAFAVDFEYTYEGQTLTYTILDEEAKTCEVSGYVNKPTHHLTIPAETFTYSVTSIGEKAFIFCSGLTSVQIHNSVTSIVKNAF
ncbi:MAG: leucine-rich repeat domain-containing protein, partial [Muribaculaceae bacterium]|nr:leucine-rich repeat domain-containing protein [Muribaculaceae bacterium]